MKQISSLLLLTLLIACTKKTPLEKLIREADVVKVLMYSGDQLVLRYETNNVKQIKEWTNYIGGDSAIVFNNCEQEGKIIFKFSEDSTVMKFSINPPCTYVTYELKGIRYERPLTAKGKKYIDSLRRVK
jgi:hypothetical protein